MKNEPRVGRIEAFRTPQTDLVENRDALPHAAGLLGVRRFVVGLLVALVSSVWSRNRPVQAGGECLKPAFKKIWHLGAERWQRTEAWPSAGLSGATSKLAGLIANHELPFEWEKCTAAPGDPKKTELLPTQDLEKKPPARSGPALGWCHPCVRKNMEISKI
jgi:hypothetical protein